MAAVLVDAALPAAASAATASCLTHDAHQLLAGGRAAALAREPLVSTEDRVRAAVEEV